jgi:hypothetical protein
MRLKALAAAVAATCVVLAGTSSADARRYKAERTAERDIENGVERTTTTRKSKSHRRTAGYHRATSHVRPERHEGADLGSFAENGIEQTATPRRSKSYRRTAGYHRSTSYTRSASYEGASAGARPRRWCGWWMRTQRGGGPEYNLAWNWRNYGSASGPQVGAVVVWRHHVGEITGQTASGQWIVRSGNDGGRVRERARSVAGALFRI